MLAMFSIWLRLFTIWASISYLLMSAFGFFGCRQSQKLTCGSMVANGTHISGGQAPDCFFGSNLLLLRIAGPDFTGTIQFDQYNIMSFAVGTHFHSR